MEGRVEACHLRQLRQPLQQEPDGRQVVRLVQRRERHELLERVEHCGVRAHRPRVFHAAVHHPMSDAGEAPAP